MNIEQMINTLEKYKKISSDLELKNDTKILEEVMSFLANNKPEKSVIKKTHSNPESDFNDIVACDGMNLEDFSIDEKIVLNKNNIIDFWLALDNEVKEKFTLFELNVILFLISNKFNKYLKKDKKYLVSFIYEMVKSKRMEKSYREITV